VLPTGEVAPEPLSERNGKPPGTLGTSRLHVPNPGRGTFIAAGVVIGLIALVFGAIRLDSPDLKTTGPAANARIGAVARQSLAFTVSASNQTLDHTAWILDGNDVSDRVERTGDTATLSGKAMPNGEHWLTVRADGRLPGSRTQHTWHFIVNTKPPAVDLDPSAIRATVGRPMTFGGTVPAGSTVQVAGRDAPVTGTHFAVAMSSPPEQPLEVSATDPFGNTSLRVVNVQVVPRTPRAPVRAVHMTFWAWKDPVLKRGVMRLIAEHRVNTVELDLKDESGMVGFKTDIPLARSIGAEKDVYDLRAAVRQLHAKGVMVVGRIVAFRDPIYATAAWKRGWKSQVIQTPSGGEYSGYGGFTNFASPTVRKYNVDIARAAAQDGIDDVLYDYVRRPDGPISTMRFPGLQGTPERSIATFLGEARQAIRPYGTFLGASVFGVAATRPTEVAQNIQKIGRNVDYVAPMVYPSHWANGEYNVPDPNAEPYPIVQRSLRDFEHDVRGTGARVVPWLQDFSLGVTYGPAQVAAQIRAAHADGINEWLLWDPNVAYTAGGLPHAPAVPPPGSKPVQPPTVAPAKTTHRVAALALKPNELGQVPVMMYHQIRADGGGVYDVTPAQFRAELGRLWRQGYWPVRAIDLVTGNLNVPKGKTPVVMTFDDSTREQYALDGNGNPLPDTAIGIMLAFAKQHPRFKPAGTFFINREPFAGVRQGPEMLRWLNAHGFEVADHTKDHLPLNTLDSVQVQRQIALGQQIIKSAIPGDEVRDFALPLGMEPNKRSLSWRGSWHGIDYTMAGVFLVGAEPSPSPFAKKFDPHAIPRIRTTPPGVGPQEFGSSWWLDILQHDPSRRYVSDGDPHTISFPRDEESQLAPRFRAKARPY
jgi:peptidoglycan/xylan/chitin deacetylase (PgdA/CDA1 family)